MELKQQMWLAKHKKETIYMIFLDMHRAYKHIE